MDQGSEQQDALPVRRRRSRSGGRHRDPHAITVPAGAPALVLGVPGAAAPDVGYLMSTLAHEIAALCGGSAGAGEAGEGPGEGVSISYGHLAGADGSLSALVAGIEPSSVPGTPAAVVVPMFTGPRPALEDPLRTAVAAAGAAVAVTEPLGPHPLLAGGLHTRLAEAGLARADRARMLSVGTAADGVLVVTLGGAAGAEAAEAGAVLLASRLAVPVVSAALDTDQSPEGDSEDDWAAALHDGAARLREMGSVQPAVAPCLLGSEADMGRLQEMLKGKFQN